MRLTVFTNTLRSLRVFQVLERLRVIMRGGRLYERTL
jgi:hypothetical protein